MLAIATSHFQVSIEIISLPNWIGRKTQMEENKGLSGWVADC